MTSPNAAPRRRGLFNSRAIHPRRMGAAVLLGMAAVLGSPAAANDPQEPATTSAQEKTQPQAGLRAHGVAAFGVPKYGPGFTHFDYVNPDAPKGGEFSTASGASGTYDSLNPYILKGVAVPELSLLYDTLMVRSIDEPSSAYGLVAESVEIAPDRSSITFHIRRQARWHDGTPMTAHDVAWTFATLREKGHPFFRNNYTDVKGVTAVDDYTVRFDLPPGSNRLMPLILGDMPVLPKHYWEKVAVSFDSSGNVKPLGSGPYRIASYDLGRDMIFQRVPDYWAAGLPVNRGRYNFDRVRIEYFLDSTARFEAFKGGQYNFFRETVAKRWATEYDFPARRDGRVVAESIPHNEPAGMQGFVFNTRREKFSDPRVREAIGLLFNFEWGNEFLAYSAYTRSDSYFENSTLASAGLPQGREREILEKFRGRIPDDIFTAPFSLPDYTRQGRGPDMKLRENMRRAMVLLREAGYEVRNQRMVHAQTGQKLSFEFLLISPVFERWIMPYQHNLNRIGIETTVRTVDSAQYINRFQNFDFDMVVASIGQTNTPGSEQRNYWTSEAAKHPGSRNYAGVRDPVVDELVEIVVAAQTQEELHAATAALDRVLLRGHYIVPHYHINSYRVAYGRELERPRQPMNFRLELSEIDTWWSKDAPKPRPPAP